MTARRPVAVTPFSSTYHAPANQQLFTIASGFCSTSLIPMQAKYRIKANPKPQKNNMQLVLELISSTLHKYQISSEYLTLST